MVPRWLEHPRTRGFAIDSPETTDRRRAIIASKPFLARIYQEWYRSIANSLPTGSEPVLELGAGAGFLDEYVERVIRSEVFPCRGISVILDARHLPFTPESLRAIAMTDVLHHVPDVRSFFRDAAVCVRNGGVIAMIEPWVSPWSRIVYGHFHHEPFIPTSDKWEFEGIGPLSSANGALPWILFDRDRAQFEREFPEWRIERVDLAMPFRYVLSGGVSMRSLMPGWSFPAWRRLEHWLDPWMDRIAMFAKIVLRRVRVDET
jgi:SAM-dependent methyltransferase